MQTKITSKSVAHRLKLVLDPEIGINIVDLGLVYGITCNDDTVDVKVTMTTMGCPMSRYINISIENVLTKMPGVNHSTVEVVWSPAWSPLMIAPGILSRKRK